MFNRGRAYCHQPGANPNSVADTEKFLMKKPKKDLPDLGIEPRTSCSAVMLRPLNQRGIKIKAVEIIKLLRYISYRILQEFVSSKGCKTPLNEAERHLLSSSLVYVYAKIIAGKLLFILG